MPQNKIEAAATGPPGALARPDWRAGGDFAAADLRVEQKYNAQRIRRHLRMVHGWGIVCGLHVVSAGDADLGHAWDLFICPGYGIGPCGDEILVNKKLRFNLSDYLWTRPLGPQLGTKASRAWISLEASDEPAAYEPAEVPDCGCGGSSEKPSRVVEGVRIVVTWTPPLSLFFGRAFDACAGGTPACPECPDTCALPIAAVILPAEGEMILNSEIENLGEI